MSGRDTSRTSVTASIMNVPMRSNAMLLNIKEENKQNEIKQFDN